MDQDWVRDQVEFWYGANNIEASSADWRDIFRLLEASDYRRGITRYPTVFDGTVEAFRECYSQLAEYNFPGNAEVIRDIAAHDYVGKLDHSYYLPVLMVDQIGLDLPVISYNRLVGDTGSRVFLWPNSYHLGIAREGLLDDERLSVKENRIIFRGALSGPMKTSQIEAGLTKVSRAEFILSLHTERGIIDLGVTSIPQQLLSDPDFMALSSRIAKLRKPHIPMRELLKHKYVLCLEGSDISSGFGGILASHSVPFHPYPFCYETWFFNGLKPWEHFVPVALDGGDLLELWEYCEHHPRRVELISLAGRKHMTERCSASALAQIKADFVDRWDLRSKAAIGE